MRQLVLFCLLLIHAQLFAKVTEQEILVVGTDFAYLYEKNSKSEPVGFAVDILKKLAEKNGYSLRFEFYPWSRAQWMVEQGQAHILVGPYKTPEREQRFLFAKRPFYRDQMVFYVRKGEDFTWDGSYGSLMNSRVAVVQGWVYGEEFEKRRSVLKLVTANNLSVGMNMLLAKRFDYLAVNLRNAEGLFREWRDGKMLISIKPILSQQDGYLAYCRTALCEKLQKDFDVGFQEMITNGEVSNLLKAYMFTFPWD